MGKARRKTRYRTPAGFRVRRAQAVKKVKRRHERRR